MALRRLVACALLVFATTVPASGQVGDPKAAFLQALGRFSAALDGPVGDEGRSVRAALDAMTRGLGEWDAALLAFQVASATELPRADPALAARMHVALGAAYLDRHRVADALRELDAAIRLDPGRPEAFTFQGLAYSQLANDFDRAAASFRRAAAVDPSNPVPAYQLGRSLMKQGRADEARQAFQTVLDLWTKRARERPSAAPDAPFVTLGLVQEQSSVEPYFPPAMYAEGFALLQRGEFAPGLDALGLAAARDMLVANPVEPRDAMGLAAAAYREGATEIAARHLGVAIELDPIRAEPHRLLGRVLLADRRDEGALKELQAAVALSHGDERAYLTLSDALVELQRYADAERVLRDLLRGVPASGKAHQKLARLYQRQNQTLDALREFEAAITLNPLIGLSRDLQTIGALNAAQQDFDAAVAAYSRGVDVHPNDADAHRVLGYTYSRLERRDEALAEFAVALLLDPGLGDVYVGMSQLYLRHGEFAAAADAARQAVTLNGTNRQARYALGTALMRLDKPDEAREQLEVFERLQAEETAASARQMTLNGLRREAAVRSDNREYDRAVALLRRALELAPDTPASHVELGLALLASEQPADALDHFKTAERLRASLEVHRHLAAAYAALGQNAESERELATYRRLRSETLRGDADR